MLYPKSDCSSHPRAMSIHLGRELYRHIACDGFHGRPALCRTGSTSLWLIFTPALARPPGRNRSRRHIGPPLSRSEPVCGSACPARRRAIPGQARRCRCHRSEARCHRLLRYNAYTSLCAFGSEMNFTARLDIRYGPFTTSLGTFRSALRGQGPQQSLQNSC